MKYSIITFGCRVNQADSLQIEAELRANAGRSVPLHEADLVVVNTCSVTAAADQGARQTIRRVSRLNPGARVVATGCYATRCPEEVSSLAGGVHTVPNRRKEDLVQILGLSRRPGSDVAHLPSLCDETSETLSTAQRFGQGDGACGLTIEPGMAGRTAFTLCVQTGCSEPCSYCIIPTTRGQPRSLRIADVVAQVIWARTAGFKEITLTGVHLGSYGRDLQPASSLERLLKTLAERADSDVLFRISSLEPMDCSRAILDVVTRHSCFAPHFHLPLQHASDRILAAMRRPYTLAQYRQLVDEIRDRVPDASIGTDVIVGFPGETDEDCKGLSAYLEDSPLTHAHVFPYSDRPGTLAARLPAKVDPRVTRARARYVRAIADRLSRRFACSQVGTVQRALTLDDGTVAVTGNYLKVRVPTGRQRNEWVRLRITSEHDGELLSG